MDRPIYSTSLDGSTIRTVLAHPDGGNLYASPYLWRDASYAFTESYSRGRLADGGWRMVELDDVPEHLRQDAAELTPGEYVDDRDRAYCTLPPTMPPCMIEAGSPACSPACMYRRAEG